MIFIVVWGIYNGEINYSSGFRTSRSIKNKENWKKANLLYGKYSFILGIVLFVFVIIMRYIQPLPMGWNSTIISTINIICMLVLGIFVNSKLKD